MRYPVLASIFFHAVIVAVGFAGLPALRNPPPAPEIPIVVELVDLGPVTNLPTARELKKEEPKPAPAKVKEAPEPPPPPPPIAKAPPPPPPPAPPREEVAAVPPPPKPKPAPKKEPKPDPKPKPKKEVKEPEPKTPERLAKAKPRRKPPPPDPFAGVLKTVERLKDQPPPKKDEKKKAKAPEKKPGKKKDDFQTRIAKALSRRPTAHDPNRRISISERDALISAIRDQVTKCWSLPAGAKGAEDMIIEIKVAVNPDGRVKTASITNSGRMFTDPFFRAMAESALRAVKNPRCSPFKVPVERYDVWKDLTLVFNPKEMFGG